MSHDAMVQAHIAYELVDERNPDVMVIAFRTAEIVDSGTAHELSEQLDALIRPDLPRYYVIDFGNARSLSSGAVRHHRDLRPSGRSAVGLQPS